MRYIQRDKKTKEVIGHFACEQPYAKEAVADDHPDILAFTAKRREDQEKVSERARNILERVEELEQRVSALENSGITA